MDFILNSDQRTFAEKNHNLVYKFLNSRRLPMDEFYDVIIFGYLQAVYNYMEREKLRKYRFSTIAWKSMNSCIGKYYQTQNRQKRKAVVVSLSDVLKSGLVREETVADRRFSLFSDLSVSEFYMHFDSETEKMLRMKEFGYTNGEIARQFKKPVHVIANNLRSIYQFASELLAG